MAIRGLDIFARSVSLSLSLPLSEDADGSSSPCQSAAAATPGGLRMECWHKTRHEGSLLLLQDEMEEFDKLLLQAEAS